MPDIGSGVMFSSMGLSSISAITNSLSQAGAIRAQGDYEDTISRTNATIARYQAQQTLEAGDIEASRQNIKTQAAVGTERAMQGGSGIDVASASSALTRLSTANAGAMDELTIRNNAARRAWGFQTEALQDTFAGKFAQMTAKNKAFQTVLTGGIQSIEAPLAIESNYLRFSRYGGSGAGGVPYDLG